MHTVSKTINLMTTEQSEFLQELHETLLAILVDKSRLYLQTTIRSDGRNTRLISREEYLDFNIGILIEKLEEAFPKLGE